LSRLFHVDQRASKRWYLLMQLAFLRYEGVRLLDGAARLEKGGSYQS
jgi:hypothetical protein